MSKTEITNLEPRELIWMIKMTHEFKRCRGGSLERFILSLKYSYKLTPEQIEYIKTKLKAKFK